MNAGNETIRLAAIGDLFRQQIHGIRRFGTASLDLCSVGCGQFDRDFADFADDQLRHVGVVGLELGRDGDLHPEVHLRRRDVSDLRQPDQRWVRFGQQELRVVWRSDLHAEDHGQHLRRYGDHARQRRSVPLHPHCHMNPFALCSSEPRHEPLGCRERGFTNPEPQEKIDELIHRSHGVDYSVGP